MSHEGEAMDTHRSDDPRAPRTDGLSRRTALLRTGAGGLAAALVGAVGLQRRAAAQAATPTPPTSWRTEHLEVEFTPGTPLPGVSITLAGGGPPQRGDWFYVDTPLYAAGDAGGTQIGTYQCFGAWTHAATDDAAPEHRLTTVQYHLQDGSIMGLINEIAADPTTLVGAVQGGTGRYTGALGTFQQLDAPEIPATTDASGTPTAAVGVVRVPFDLILPNLG
jgi:hypothetical protein